MGSNVSSSGPDSYRDENIKNQSSHKTTAGTLTGNF